MTEKAVTGVITKIFYNLENPNMPCKIFLDTLKDKEVDYIGFFNNEKEKYKDEAVQFREGDTVRIAYYASKNGMYWNGIRITPKEGPTEKQIKKLPDDEKTKMILQEVQEIEGVLEVFTNNITGKLGKIKETINSEGSRSDSRN